MLDELSMFGFLLPVVNLHESESLVLAGSELSILVALYFRKPHSLSYPEMWTRVAGDAFPGGSGSCNFIILFLQGPSLRLPQVCFQNAPPNPGGLNECIALLLATI